MKNVKCISVCYRLCFHMVQLRKFVSVVLALDITLFMNNNQTCVKSVNCLLSGHDSGMEVSWCLSLLCNVCVFV